MPVQVRCNWAVRLDEIPTFDVHGEPYGTVHLVESIQDDREPIGFFRWGQCHRL